MNMARGPVAAFLTKLLVPAFSLAAIAPLQSQADDVAYPAMAPVAQYMMDKTAEIALARTAAPKQISDDATILVLDKDGYETAVKGSNGFTCLVGRSWMNDFGAVDFWDPRDLTPNCWNEAAVKSQLGEFLQRTRWVLAGVSKDEMAARTNAAWASHEYTLPAPGTVAYMMSKEQCIHAPAPCSWYPHVMFFEATADAQKWGDNIKGVPVISGVSKTDPVTTFMVLVPKWSDGTPSPYATAAVPAEHKH
ncbi:MAG TPA: hypothetical protein VFK21_00630 [Gammaproteobacteria bacterium]|nr:hypothetical protein [Gammaproteobacteria bacterium]